MKIWKVFIITLTATPALCTISGLSYMDPINFKPVPKWPRGEDPCNPLYWYPRDIPEECRYSNSPKPVIELQPPLPLPNPVPVPISPIPMPVQQPLPFPVPPIPMPFIPMPGAPPYMAVPGPIPMPLPPLPYGIPIAPTNPMLPVAGVPYPFLSPYPAPYGPARQTGMVPGLPGLVSPEGGINIMPFSDAYSDMLEKHKRKMVRIRLEKILQKYDGNRGYKRRGNCVKREMLAAYSE